MSRAPSSSELNIKRIWASLVFFLSYPLLCLLKIMAIDFFFLYLGFSEMFVIQFDGSWD